MAEAAEVAEEEAETTASLLATATAAQARVKATSLLGSMSSRERRSPQPGQARPQPGQQEGTATECSAATAPSSSATTSSCLRRNAGSVVAGCEGLTTARGQAMISTRARQGGRRPRKCIGCTCPATGTRSPTGTSMTTPICHVVVGSFSDDGQCATRTTTSSISLRGRPTRATTVPASHLGSHDA